MLNVDPSSAFGLLRMTLAFENGTGASAAILSLCPHQVQSLLLADLEIRQHVVEVEPRDENRHVPWGTFDELTVLAFLDLDVLATYPLSPTVRRDHAVDMQRLTRLECRAELRSLEHDLVLADQEHSELLVLCVEQTDRADVALSRSRVLGKRAGERDAELRMDTLRSRACVDRVGVVVVAGHGGRAFVGRSVAVVVEAVAELWRSLEDGFHGIVAVETAGAHQAVVRRRFTSLLALCAFGCEAVAVEILCEDFVVCRVLPVVLVGLPVTVIVEFVARLDSSWMHVDVHVVAIADLVGVARWLIACEHDLSVVVAIAVTIEIEPPGLLDVLIGLAVAVVIDSVADLDGFWIDLRIQIVAIVAVGDETCFSFAGARLLLLVAEAVLV